MKKSPKSHYNKRHKPKERSLRKNSTPAEIRLWAEVLRARRFHGYPFNRQYPIGPYIADFVCRQLRLIVEIDGYSHRFKEEEDRERDRALVDLGYRVVRFPEKEVMQHLDNVVLVLEEYLPEGQSH
jgi:very-short-patch-repair endonuclease